MSPLFSLQVWLKIPTCKSESHCNRPLPTERPYDLQSHICIVVVNSAPPIATNPISTSSRLWNSLCRKWINVFKHIYGTNGAAQITILLGAIIQCMFFNKLLISMFESMEFLRAIPVGKGLDPGGFVKVKKSELLDKMLNDLWLKFEGMYNICWKSWSCCEFWNPWWAHSEGCTGSYEEFMIMDIRWNG